MSSGRPVWADGARRALGFVAIALFFVAPWCRSTSARGLFDDGAATTGSGLVAYRGRQLADGGWTSPIHLFEERSERAAYLSVETSYWLLLLGGIPLGGLLLLIGPRRHALVTSLGLVATAGATTVLLRSIVTPGGVFAWGHLSASSVGEWAVASTPLLAAGLASHALVLRPSRARWPLRALLALALGAAAIAPLLAAERGYETHWSIGQQALWGLPVTTLVLCTASLLHSRVRPFAPGRQAILPRRTS